MRECDFNCLLAAYRRESDFTHAFAIQLDAARAVANARALSGGDPASHSAAAILEREAVDWSELKEEAAAWRGPLDEVVARLGAATAAAAAASVSNLEKAHMGLTTLRAIFGAQTRLSAASAARPPIEGLAAGLLMVVQIALAQLRARADEALPKPSAAAVAEQDAAVPSLEALGCGTVLSSLRALRSVAELQGAADEAESAIAPRPASVEEALLFAQLRASCDDPSSPPADTSAALASGRCRKRWDEACASLAELLGPDSAAEASSGSPAEAEAAAAAGTAEAGAAESAVEALFRACDKNGDGKVSKRELKTAIKADASVGSKLGLKRLKDAAAFVDRADTDGDGALDLAEFKAMLAPPHQVLSTSTSQPPAATSSQPAPKGAGVGVNSARGSEDRADPDAPTLRPLLHLLRTCRPLALGLPGTPAWTRRAAANSGGGGEGLLEAAAIHMQTHWRARRARRAAAEALAARAEQVVAAGGGAADFELRVLRLRSALASGHKSAAASAAMLVDAMRPAEAIDRMQGLQRRVGLQLSALTLAMVSPLVSGSPPPPSRSPHRQAVQAQAPPFGLVSRTQVASPPHAALGSPHAAQGSPPMPPLPASEATQAIITAAHQLVVAPPPAAVSSLAPAEVAAATAAAFWSRHFREEPSGSVPFERLKYAAEDELGPLSSVDVQLLRLEIMDERGRLSRAALTRLVAGEIDGSRGHSSVPAALRSLLDSARAQLDRQVEVRMRQAAASRSGGARARPVPRTMGPLDLKASPIERRVKLDFGM